MEFNLLAITFLVKLQDVLTLNYKPPVDSIPILLHP